MEEQLFEFIAQFIILTPEEKNAILELDIFKQYPKDTILLKEGEISNKSYFVIKGGLRTYYMIDGEEKTTEFYTEMEAIAPATTLNQQPSQYYLSCIEDSILCVSTPNMEQGVFDQFPRIKSLCLMQSETLLAKNQRDFSEFKTSSPEQRYLNLLEKRPHLIQKVPQYQIASYLGIKPESLSRIRKRLKDNK